MKDGKVFRKGLLHIGGKKLARLLGWRGHTVMGITKIENGKFVLRLAGPDCEQVIEADEIPILQARR